MIVDEGVVGMGNFWGWCGDGGWQLIVWPGLASLSVIRQIATCIFGVLGLI